MPRSTKKIKKRKSRAVVNQNNNLQTERNTKHSDWSALRIQTETLLFYYENLDKPLRWLSNKEGMMHGAPCRITKSTLQRWVKHYERYGEPKAITKQYISSRKGKKKLTHEQQIVLKNLALKYPEDYLDELQNRMVASGLPKIHTSTIYVYLKSIGLSLNNLTRIAKERSEVERAAFYKRIEGLDPHMFVFMDETAKDRKAARRRRGWVETGSDCKIIRRFMDKDDRFTLLAAMNINGFIPAACMKVDRDKENIDSDFFLHYLTTCLIPCMGKFAKGEENSILIIDNASIHNHMEIRNLIEEAGGIVIFTAPYSPDLNPMEYAFNLYKKKLKRYRRILNDGHAHLLALTEIGKEDLVTTFAHCFPDCKFDLPNSKSDKVRNALIKDVVNEIAMDM